MRFPVGGYCHSVDAFAWTVVGSVVGVVAAAAVILFGLFPLLRTRCKIRQRHTPAMPRTKASGGQGVQVGSGNEQANQFIQTHGEHFLDQSVPASGAVIVRLVSQWAPADLSVDVYLDTNDNKVINEVMGRVDELVEVMGYRQVGSVEVERGSIFRRSRAVADLVADELKSRLMKVERAFELAQLELRQANVDISEADAVNRLLASLENVPRACLRVGSILVIKYPHSSTGDSIVIVRNLSQLELYTLASFPEIQRSPETALDALTMTLDNMPKQYGQLADGDSGFSPPAV